MPQALYFMDLALERMRADARLLALTYRMAHHADGKDFQRFLRDLERGE
jgi:hypothetical protein